MADDITLTVRVRNLTRGEFDRLGAQLRRTNRDMRRVGGSSQMSGDQVQRFGDNIRGVSQRMNQLRRTGNLAGHDMDYVRRTLGILGRELRHAARNGELTEDQFRALRRELDRTGLDFDQLSRDVTRHNAIQQRLHREQERRRKEAARLAREAARQADRQARDAERQAREAERRLAAQQRQDLNRLRSGSGDADFTMRFRSTGDDDIRRMNASIGRMQSSLQGLSGSSARASRTIGILNRDFATMTRVLDEAGDAGTIARRDFDAVNNGLTVLTRTARQLVRSGDMTRSTFRDMSRDAALLRARLILIGREGRVFTRLTARARLFQNQLRDTADSTTGMRRAFARTGDFGMRGMLGAMLAAGALGRALLVLTSRIKLTRRAMTILIATLVLIGPAAQAVGLLLLAALGGAFIALGAVALRGASDVRRAFTEMKNDVSSVVKEAAQPMRVDLVEAMGNVGDAAKEMQPTLTAAFAAAGPLIDNLFGGITDLLAHALPGFTAALQNSGQAMAGFRTAMGLVGRGFGEMMRIITQGNEDELERAWIVLGSELENLLESLGEFISTALNSETATMLLVTVFRTATGALNLLGAALDVVDTAFGGLFRSITDSMSSMDRFKGLSEGIGSAFKMSGASIDDMKARLKAVKTESAALAEQLAIVPERTRELMPAWEEYNKLLSEGATLEGAIAAATAAAAAEQAKQVQTVGQLYEALFKLADAQRGSIDAQAALEEAYDKGMEGASKYAGKLKVVNGEFDLNSKAAREVWSRLSDVISATKESAQAAIDSKSGWDTVLERWNTGREKLIALAEELGVSDEGIRILTESILGVPDKTAYLKANVDDLNRKLKAAREKLKREPGDARRAKATLNIDALLWSLQKAQDELNSLDGRRVTTYVQTHHFSTTGSGLKEIPFAAHGGVIGAASGGPRSNTVMVGEHGPELVDLAPGTRVHSNPDTRRMVDAAYGGGGGGGGSVIAIQLTIGDKYLGEVMVDPLRKAVRTRGGNVQAVLGQRGA